MGYGHSAEGELQVGQSKGRHTDRQMRLEGSSESWPWREGMAWGGVGAVTAGVEQWELPPGSHSEKALIDLEHRK